MEMSKVTSQGFVNIYEFGVKYSQSADKDKQLIDKDGNLQRMLFIILHLKKTITVFLVVINIQNEHQVILVIHKKQIIV